MTKEIKKAVVLGNGGWGTSLALIMHANGIDTRLWCAFPEEADKLRSTRRNERYLPGIELPEGLTITADPFAAAADVDLALSVVPTQFLRSVSERFEDALAGHVPLASATKGIEIETFKRPDQILRDVFGRRPFCVVTGPTHAEEVARGMPASAVAASYDAQLAMAVQKALSCDSLRVYTNGDPIGAQLGGALKNVIAIAAGISDGLELGDNAKAALLTRGIVEMARFGKMHGAETETFFGLAGIGDLATTCYSKHSRNRSVGERIGRGATLEEILKEMKMVAEGVWTTKALFGPESDARRVQMPIAQQVHAVLFEGQDPRKAVTELMRRDLSGEMEGLEFQA
ncbi:MAG: glycerol-3-phosphate dehydrogenase (NAD(P)+) [Planctomycetota bacterium]|jgi:glycerol-3-phosphate dehydrogenase (NAD(P)+)